MKRVDITPELINIGSFEKCWKLIDGHWYMIKKGSYKENLALSGVLNDNALEKTWYSTSFTKNNYNPVLKEYNYDIPQIYFSYTLRVIILKTNQKIAISCHKV